MSDDDLIEKALNLVPWFFTATGALAGLVTTALVWSGAVSFSHAGWFVSLGSAVVLALYQSLFNDMRAEMRDTADLLKRATETIRSQQEEIERLRND